jgi:ABC-type antimicrobial peptide transport system permease subunit
VETVQTFSDTLENLETDPLSVGLIGLLFLSFIIVLVLSIISLLTYAGLTAQFRRAEFGVLRALGVSSARLILSLALEQVMVTAVAVIIGAIIGVILSTQVLPTLASSITTQTIAPPFIVQTETDALLQYGLVMLIILFVVLGFTLLLVRQLSLAQAIKLGEE